MSAPGGTQRATFRPRFMLVVLYLMGFMFLFGMICMGPDLVEAARQLPPGDGPLTEEELAQAREVARQALTGRLHLVFGAAFVVTALGAYARRLPGLRD